MSIRNEGKENKICGRICVEVKARLDSPLSIGSGNDEHTDSDVLVTAAGEPFIPGSALAGVFRSYLRTQLGDERAGDLFGNLGREKRKGGKDGDVPERDERQSRIFIYDALVENPVIMMRDGVKLNERKASEYQSKYQVQTVERGAQVKFRLELLERKADLNQSEEMDLEKVWRRDLEGIETLLFGLSEGELRIGSKSRRGFGKIKVLEAKAKCFDLTAPEEYLEWLDWDWDRPEAFARSQQLEFKTNKRRTEHCLRVPLQLEGTILIREYTGTFAGEYSCRQMTVGNEGKQAVIPGSTWAGAVRSQTSKLVKEIVRLNSWEKAQEKLEPFFGPWKADDGKQEGMYASKLVFEESLIHGGCELPATRIAVDRLTGGVAVGAVFNEKIWAGGDTELVIRWPDQSDSDVICGLLLLAVADLKSGFLPVGGETAVGRGIFTGAAQKPVLLDGCELKQTELYTRAAMEWMDSLGRKYDD